MNPATEKQRAALAKLGVAASASLTVREASEAIERAIEERDTRREDERLSLATIRARDPYGGRGNSRGQHYLCPFPACRGHQNPKEHRSLSVATSGEYQCHRCDAKGLLADSVRAGRPGAVEPPRYSRAARDRSAASAFLLRPAPQSKEPLNPKVEEMLAGCVPIIGTDGERYLEGRGIPGTAAHESGVLYHPAWYRPGQRAVVFRARDEQGRVTGAQGRLLDPNAKVTKLNVGSFASAGGLFATRGAGGARVLVIAEAPIDVLSIFTATGIPGVALFGKTFSSCLPRRCAGKHVFIVTDSDGGGNECAAHLRDALTICASVKRIHWPDGIKDANELLVKDCEALGVLFGIREAAPPKALPLPPVEVDQDGMSLLDYASERLGFDSVA